MRTILKKGEQVKIFHPPSGTFPARQEGTATLIKLVRRNHDSVPPTEVWLVRFDDDGEVVERTIPVSISLPGMASSLARSAESKNLLAFMASAGLSDDWADPSGHGVTAWVSGKVLNNEVGAVELAGNRQVNDELLVHLECPEAKLVVNLNTLLVLATGYIRVQYSVAAAATQYLKTLETVLPSCENESQVPDSHTGEARIDPPTA